MREKPLILVVDDEPFNVDYLEQELEDLEYDTESAYDGEEALEQVAATSPDLILLDIMMPKLNGFQVLERLQADSATRDIPVIIISAMTDMESIVRGIEMGAEDYLPKPFEPALLEARIKAGVQKKVWRDKEKEYLGQIETEKKRADDLLHVILPDNIVNELKENGKVAPREHQTVAVLFTDIVGFTAYCDTHEPDEVVTNLQQLVEIFEEISVEHDIQKIKTIGDAFMAVSGLLHSAENPVSSAIHCARHMIEATEKMDNPWSIRVGIHVGSVVAGVIGKRQYLYDIWGDTVNTAQRIESNGRPGCVNLSKDAWEMVQGEYPEPKNIETLELKGKGEYQIYSL